jgi:Co/Zn/Cd efflux system component
MGHSHSHHEHHDHSTSAKPKVLNKQRILRRLALVLFCWIATCGTKLVQTATNVNGAKRFVGLSQNDWISFVITSIALTSAKKVMSAVQESVERFRRFAEGIRKHSSTADVQESLDPQHLQVPLADKADADRVTWIGVAVNLLLSVGKLGVGITAHSSALVADAGHSLSDLVSDFITLWAVNVARLPPDEDHPYGHYKFEAIGSLFLSLTLLATGASVGLMANKQLMEVLSATASSSASKVPVQLPGPLALVMAGLSIFSKEWLFRITKQVGERLRSPVVIANAWHHRSDAYSSVLALFSIAWAMVGFPAADAAAGMYVQHIRTDFLFIY